MLQRTLDAAKVYFRHLNSVSSPTINHVTFQIYTGWFYTSIVLVKLIFLHNNDINGGAVATDNDVPPEVSDLIARHGDDYASQGVHNMTSSLSATSLHDSITAAGAEIIQLFQSFIEMARAAAPEAGGEPETGNMADKSVLWKISMWQQGVSAGLKKRMESYTPSILPPHRMSAPSHQPQRPRCTSSAFPAEARPYPQQPTQAMDYGGPVNYGYFDNGIMSAYPQVQQAPIDPWMWDLVMEDVNMFNM
jgi:hypothetical protein